MQPHSVTEGTGKQAAQKTPFRSAVGGLITTAASTGIMIFLGDGKNKHAYLVGAILLLMGIALTVNGYVLASKE